MTNVTLIQTSDPDLYTEMLDHSSRINRTYAQRYGFEYISSIGIERGFHPWQASLNRILLLDRLIAEGQREWLFYLDADAYVFGQDFDVRELIQSAGKPMIFGPGGREGPWDVNAGVFLMNLNDPITREVSRLWRDGFMAISDSDLEAESSWGEVVDDQRLLHAILDSRRDLLAGLHMAERSFFNDYHATFVRQALRGHGFSIPERIAMIQRDMPHCFAKETDQETLGN